MVEFHPAVWIFDDNLKEIDCKYADTDPILEELKGTYTNRIGNIKSKSVSWNHGLDSILDALIQKGLLIKGFQEYGYSPYNCFNNTIEIEKGKFQIKGLEGKNPMLYSVVAKILIYQQYKF